MNTFILDTTYKIRNYRMCRVEHWEVHTAALVLGKVLSALLTLKSDSTIYRFNQGWYQVVQVQARQAFLGGPAIPVHVSLLNRQ